MQNKKAQLSIMAILGVLIVLFVAASVIIKVNNKNASDKRSQLVSSEHKAKKSSKTKMVKGYKKDDVTFKRGESSQKTKSSESDNQKESQAMKDSNGYIIEKSSTVELTDSDLEGLSAKELTYARNEIYARHGRKFESSELNDYFSSKSWYTANDSYDDDSLSDVEKANAEEIADYQEDNQLEYSPQ